MWYYKQTEPRLWTVGHGDSRDDWTTDSDHDSRESAAARVALLNGGDHNAATLADAVAQITALRTQLAAAQARITELEQHIIMLTKLPTWQPVEDGFEYAYDGRRLYASGRDLEMNNDANEGDRWVLLPDDLRLCRFTPTP